MPNSRKVQEVYVHCSATPWGDAMVFDEWHRLQRGWSGIGYHFVVLNGRPKADVLYWDFLDGQIQPGRRLDDDPIFEPQEIGAHVAGRNRSSVGFCLVGRDSFTDLQLISAKKLSIALLDHFGLGIINLKGHYEDEHTHKTCPNIPCSAFRDYVSDKISLQVLQNCIFDQKVLNWANLEEKNEKEWYAEWLVKHSEAENG